jgi:3-hydroxyisobutyrate dehydrogenase-like beta-hydroxyacid dehydrogenase
MGSAIASHLIDAGHAVVGFDVRPSRRRALLGAEAPGAKAARNAGLIAAATCRDVGQRASIVITSLPSADALMLTVAELGKGPRCPRIVIETSTLPIEVKERARSRLDARGVVLLDCPISGTGAQARARDIVVYASGSRAAYRRVAPVLSVLARAHYFVGPFGAGSRMKFVANLLVAIHNVAAAEALVLGMKAGLDGAQVLRLVGAGAGSSRILQLRGPMMVKGRYRPPTMALANFEKDLAIIAAFARKVGARTPLFSAAAPIYAAATRQNPSLDTAAVCAVLEKMAGINVRSSRRDSLPLESLKKQLRRGDERPFQITVMRGSRWASASNTALEHAATLRQPSRHIVEPSPTTTQRSTAARRPSIISPSHFWIAAPWDLIERSNVYSRRRLKTGTILEPLRFSCNFASSNHCGFAVAGGGWLVAWVEKPTAQCIEIPETKARR